MRFMVLLVQEQRESYTELLPLYIVAGANRDIGFEIVRKFSEHQDNLIVSTSRPLDQADELKDLGKPNAENI